MKFFVYAVIGIVAVSIIAGFFIVGSPKEERLKRFDGRRVSDLQFLQSEIINYWQSKEKLPDNLDMLRDDIRGIYPPKDPNSGAGYVYEVRGPLSFALCATFVLPSLNQAAPEVTMPVGAGPYYYNQNWEHGSGYACFERTIDKEIYKPKQFK